jgi:arginine exporter protein ArgO
MKYTEAHLSIYILTAFFIISNVVWFMIIGYGFYKLVNFLNTPKVAKFIDITLEHYENQKKH